MFEEQKEKVVFKMTAKLENENTWKAKAAIFLAGFFGNSVSWLVVLFVPDSVAGWVGLMDDFVDKDGNYLIAVPFASVFVMTYIVCSLRHVPLADSGIADEDFFSGYREHVANESRRTTILISAAIGGVNAILIAITAVSRG